MATKGREFSRMFKLRIVGLILNSGQNATDFINALGISASELEQWKKQFANKVKQKRLSAGQIKDEMAFLRKEAAKPAHELKAGSVKHVLTPKTADSGNPLPMSQPREGIQSVQQA